MSQNKPQAFCDGVLAVYEVTADHELKPKYPLLRYQERTVGVKRYYMAMEAQVEVSRLVRIQKRTDVSSQDIVTIHGEQYSIKQVQYPTDTEPPCCDLSLSRVVVDYDIRPV